MEFPRSLANRREHEPMVPVVSLVAKGNSSRLVFLHRAELRVDADQPDFRTVFAICAFDASDP